MQWSVEKRSIGHPSYPSHVTKCWHDVETNCLKLLISRWVWHLIWLRLRSRLYICKCMFVCTILICSFPPGLKMYSYISCIFAPQVWAHLWQCNSNWDSEQESGIDSLWIYNWVVRVVDIFSLLLSRIIPIRTHSPAHSCQRIESLKEKKEHCQIYCCCDSIFSGRQEKTYI